MFQRYQQRGQCASASNKEESEAKALEALGGQLGVDHMIGETKLNFIINLNLATGISVI